MTSSAAVKWAPAHDPEIEKKIADLLKRLPVGYIRLAYSPDSFADAVDVGRNKIFEEIKAGRLKSRKSGARTIITHEDGMEWLRSLPAR